MGKTSFTIIIFQHIYLLHEFDLRILFMIQYNYEDVNREFANLQ